MNRKFICTLSALLIAAVFITATLPAIADVTVYITNTGKKYHTGGCRHVSKSRIPIPLADAKARGFGPCSNCSPPR